MKNTASIFTPADADTVRALTSRNTSVFELIPSTNTALSDTVKSGDTSPRIFVAHSQTSGRGRLGRSFSSEHGGIYFSFNLTVPAQRAPYEARLITPLAGVAAVCALTKLYGINVGLKWVNDIIADGKKLGGILSEAVTVGDETHITVGIGINAVNTDFPDTATSLSLLSVKEIDAGKLISAIVCEFFSRLPDIADIHREYGASLVHIGERVTVHSFDGTPDTVASVLGVNEACELLVRLENGTETALSSGEVSIIIRKNKQNT